MPCFCSLAKVSKNQQNLLDTLVFAAVKDEDSEGHADEKIYTIDDLDETSDHRSEQLLEQNSLIYPKWRKENSDENLKEETKTYESLSWEGLWLPESTEWLP